MQQFGRFLSEVDINSGRSQYRIYEYFALEIAPLLR
jgi:hypothetical protein